MHWSADLVGTPYVRFGRQRGALDCWGLVWLVYRDHAGVEIPAHADIDANSLAAVARAVRHGESSVIWRRVKEPQEFDVVVMTGLLRVEGRIRNMQFHVGVMINRRQVLHTEEPTGAVIVPTDRPDMIGRITGFYRHASR